LAESKNSDREKISKAGASGVLVDRFDHNLDPKKRLTIPSEWRLSLGMPEYVYILQDPVQKCLRLVPKELMEAKIAKLEDAAIFDPAMSEALSIIGSRMQQAMLDSQGRIRINDKLLAYAGLKTSVAMIGALRTAKLWNPSCVPEAETSESPGYSEALRKIAF
jgi:MraZ protein